MIFSAFTDKIYIRLAKRTHLVYSRSAYAVATYRSQHARALTLKFEWHNIHHKQRPVEPVLFSLLLIE